MYFSLEFTRSVAIPDVLSVLKNATEHEAFGDFVVDRESIEAISDGQVPTEPSTQGTPSTVEKSSGTVRNSLISPVLPFITPYQGTELGII